MNRLYRNLSRLSHSSKIPRLRRWIARPVTAVVTIVIGSAPGLIANTAQAQDFPSRNITIIVPFPPGGGNDIFGRLIGQRLATGFGKAVIVENRTGASGNIGAEAVVRAPADGHTMLYGNLALAWSQLIPPKPAFDSQRDLAPVSMTIRIPFVLVAHPSLPVRTFKELHALDGMKRGILTMAGGGIGSAPHLAAELFKFSSKLDITYIPYRGSGPAQIALLSGESAIAFLVPPLVQQYIGNGKMRALGVSSLNRSPVLPETPTLHEAGVKNFEALQWHGFFIPVKAPSTVVSRIHTEIVKVLAAPELKERLIGEGAEVVGSSPTEFAVYFRAEIKKWSEVAQRAGVRFD